MEDILRVVFSITMVGSVSYLITYIYLSITKTKHTVQALYPLLINIVFIIIPLYPIRQYTPVMVEGLEDVPGFEFASIYRNQIVIVVWVSGVIIMLCYSVLISLRQYLRYRADASPASDSAIAVLNQVCAEKGLTPGRVSLYSTDKHLVPIVTGFFRPAIFLPESGMDEEDIHHVLMHEVTHIKFGDNFIKLILMLIQAIHWFNPLCYLLFRNIRDALELRCDKKVVEHYTIEERRDYCETLVRLAKSGKPNRALVHTQFSIDTRSGSLYEWRVDTILDCDGEAGKKNRRWLVYYFPVIIALVLLTSAIVFETTEEKLYMVPASLDIVDDFGNPPEDLDDDSALERGEQPNFRDSAIDITNLELSFVIEGEETEEVYLYTTEERVVSFSVLPGLEQDERLHLSLCSPDTRKARLQLTLTDEEPSNSLAIAGNLEYLLLIEGDTHSSVEVYVHG